MLSEIENSKVEVTYLENPSTGVYVIHSYHGGAMGHIEKGECRRSGKYYTAYAYTGRGEAEMRTFESIGQGQVFISERGVVQC